MPSVARGAAFKAITVTLIGMRKFFVLVLILIGLLGAGVRGAEPSTSKRPLNILWLTTEDMSPWLACYGDKTAPTPNIDRLAREGVRYTRAYATSPVCAPSRHTLITGLYATQTGAMHMRNGSASKQALQRNPRAYDNIPLYEAVPPAEARCFPEYLRMAGYYATNNVKQDYQFVAPPTVWDESSRRAHYRNREEGQPFFAVFNCTFTHESGAFPEAPRRSDAVKPENVTLPPYYPDTPAVRATVAQTYNNIVGMDQWVGERLAELERDGLLDSTIIFFFSDHGVGLPRGKRNSYDSGLHVPLLVRFPDGHGAGTSDDRLVSFLDFAPTVLSVAGIQPPSYMRGRPFLGRFKAQPHAYVFSSQDRMDETTDMVRSVSDGRYRLIRNHMPTVPHVINSAYRDHIPMMKDIHAMTGENAAPQQWQMVSKRKPAEEFYDSQGDPHQVTNLIDSAEHADRIGALRAALDQWSADHEDLGRIQPESKLVRERVWPPAGKQPATADPRASIKDGLLAIECATEGASIGYRERERGERAWKIYAEPVEIDAAKPFEVVAHRIGYQRSAIVPVAASK
jgi:arylsulfatase A-like enzyme